MMSGQSVDDRRARIAGWTYAWWALVGALCGIGLVGLLTIGIAFLALGAVLAIVGVFASALRNRSAFAAVGGLGVAPLYLVWLNRGGPGQVCSTTGTTTSCLQEWSPWPFAAIAVALVLVGVLLARRNRNT